MTLSETIWDSYCEWVAPQEDYNRFIKRKKQLKRNQSKQVGEKCYCPMCGKRYVKKFDGHDFDKNKCKERFDYRYSDRTNQD